jgi:hypothetical protein
MVEAHRNRADPGDAQLINFGIEFGVTVLRIGILKKQCMDIVAGREDHSFHANVDRSILSHVY